MATSVPVTALAAGDVISAAITNTSTNSYRLISVDFSYSITDLAALIDDGMEFGLAHSDYTSAEVEECLEAVNAIDQSGKIEQERANRLVRTLGYFDGAPGTDGSKSHNNGMPVKTKLNWKIGIGQTLNLWIRNGSDTVYSAGSNIAILGKFWIKDPN